ncbi:hypothetical protein [Lactobacillus sp. PV034]|uniref:hypothetical protein n=1 Tax=Lactobacillus sp. PV034 TaxID=2594495 RepID=UPI00223FCB00|nr:hypothetical protein [Lactobacillus sp. PV034]QNQ81226.1 hypothetical protein FP432_06510 [Lactobacillus sp. PV034]
MTELIKYPSLVGIVCPKCQKQGASVTKLKTKTFSADMKISGKVNVNEVYRPEWEDDVQQVLSEKDITFTPPVTLKQILDNPIPVNVLQCEHCKKKWIPDLGTQEADQDEVLAKPAFLHIRRKKKIVGLAVNIMPMLNGALTNAFLPNGGETIIPTLVKHNSLSYFYNKSAMLASGVSAISTEEITAEAGQVIDVEVAAKLVFEKS